LHLGNLVLIDGEVFPFDGIEFNDSFRWIDVANDIAFLWMDLLDHGRADLAGHWLNAWLEFSGDFGALAVLRFYAVYRAMVRAKVAAIRDQQGGNTAIDESAANYLALARRLAVPSAPTFARPPLMITCGLSGSGKTHRSASWLAADPDGRCIRLRSDVERKRLFGLAPLQSSASAIDDGIYSAEANRRTYAHLLEQADTLLTLGYPVIVDAAFLKHAEREAFRQLAIKHQLGFGILHVEASDEALQTRIRRRQHDASEATLEVLDRQKQWFEPLTAEEQGCCQPLPPAD
jgi:predicted kinase